MSFFKLDGKKIWVAGHRGMVGSAILRKLSKLNIECLTVDKNKIDLRDSLMVRDWLSVHRPDVVILAAAKVGGIGYNEAAPAEFIYDNLMIATNVIHQSYIAEVKKLVFLGSSCVYPKFATQPIVEEELLSGSLEPTNQWYAIAKIAGIKMVEAYRKQYHSDFISVMPTNLYGPGDTYDIQKSHVVPALILKFHQAKIHNAPYVELWGTGLPRREFLYVDDLADACVFLLQNYSGDTPINIGTGEDLTIDEIAYQIKKIVGYQGEIRYNIQKPDGTPRKLLNVSKIKELGWVSTTRLSDGLLETYKDYLFRFSDQL